MLPSIEFDFDAATTRYDGRNAYWLGRCAALAYRDEETVLATEAARLAERAR